MNRISLLANLLGEAEYASLERNLEQVFEHIFRQKEEIYLSRPGVLFDMNANIGFGSYIRKSLNGTRFQ